MSDLTELIREIDVGTRGPKLAAFFVLDGGVVARTAQQAYEKASSTDPVKVFQTRLAGLIYPEVRELVRAHRRAGHTLVLLTSLSGEQTAPVADDLGIVHVLPLPTSGDRLVATARQFSAQHDINLSESFGYARDVEQLPLLEAVGYPRVINPKGRLRRISLAHGWQTLRLKSRGRPTAGQIARTGGAFAGMGATALIGLGAGLATASRHRGTNAAASLGGRLTLGLAGIKVNVVGEKHLEARPAVIVFNHQSSIDMFVIAAVLRGDLTAVAKKELARNPTFAVFGYLADMAYIDRADVVQARQALEPAIDRLRAGISLAIAPEGTRSATPTLGPFKKGAFHIAMQAGVPIIPLVLRNAGDVVWSKTVLVRPGQVDVAVLPPVSTDSWTAADLDKHVAAVRQSFIETMANWPSG